MLSFPDIDISEIYIYTIIAGLAGFLSALASLSSSYPNMTHFEADLALDLNCPGLSLHRESSRIKGDDYYIYLLIRLLTRLLLLPLLYCLLNP